jgi:hypothetical protein
MLMENIQFIGLKEIDPVDQVMVRKLCSEYYPKIDRALKNLRSVVVHIKPYTKGGARPKYSMHVRAIAPTRIFETDKVAAWELSKALRMAFDDLEKEIRHAFHDEKRPKKEARGSFI